MKFNELAFKRLCGDAKVSDYIDWAVELLYQGSNSARVAVLASYYLERRPEAEEVERDFKLCIAELGCKLPSEDEWYEVMLEFTSEICKRMLAGDIDLETGVSELLTISDDHDDPYFLTLWIFLMRDVSEAARPFDVGHVFFNASLDLSNRDECIRAVARQYIALCSRVFPDKFPWVWMCCKCDYSSDQDTWTTTLSADCPDCGGVASVRNMQHFENRDYYLSCV